MAFENLNYADQWQKAEQHYEQGLEHVDANDIVYAAYKGKSRLENLGAAPEGLEEVWEDLHVMVKLCQDYAEKNYQEISWKNIQRIAGAVSYFVTPFDLVPDALPKIGYLDDKAVIKLALKLAQEDVDRYRQWQVERGQELGEKAG